MYSKIVIKQAYRRSLWLNLHCYNAIRKVKFTLPLTQKTIAPTHKISRSASGPVIKRRKIKVTSTRKIQKGSGYPIKETTFIIHLLAFFTNNFAELRQYALTNVQYKFSSNRQI
jgi:hypothetical protein